MCGVVGSEHSLKFVGYTVWMVFVVKLQLNTKRYVTKVFISPFVSVDGIAVGQTLARRYDWKQ